MENSKPVGLQPQAILTGQRDVVFCAQACVSTDTACQGFAWENDTCLLYPHTDALMRRLAQSANPAPDYQLWIFATSSLKKPFFFSFFNTLRHLPDSNVGSDCERGRWVL